ncbi:uncharacterized protein LOC127001027 [Eriocheir sinensis]|uniref:uncharacterized protein LOC127001027 n=1 Tax=Eriocheir sinensis TaxID=95602 RepID=UPI0021C8A5D2|nr:uncharacterized protein LOC127001027 [Eriocheir sinensis]
MLHKAPAGGHDGEAGRRKRKWRNPIFRPPMPPHPNRPPPARLAHLTPYQMYMQALHNALQHQTTPLTPTPAAALQPTEAARSSHYQRVTPPPTERSGRVWPLFMPHRLRETREAALQWLMADGEMQERMTEGYEEWSVTTEDPSE